MLAEQTAARALLTCAAEAVDADAFVLGAKAPVAVIREEVHVERLVSELNLLRYAEHGELIPVGMRF